MNAAEVSLLLPISLLVAGLVLIAAEFFLPTVFLGFVGAAVSFVGIYLSAEAGALTCGLFCLAFVVVLALEFFAFRRILPQTGIGRAMINVSSNDGAAVPAAAGYAVYVGKTGKAVTVLVNGKVLFEFVEPEGVTGTRKLSSGTFALQAHDPGSEVHYKNIRVKRLP